jgi:ribosomal protein L29
MKSDLKLKEKNDKELSDLLTEKREALRQVRFGTAGNVRDAHAARKTRTDVARILTEMNARKAA